MTILKGLAFWAQGWEDGLISINLIIRAADQILAGPLPPGQRRFLRYFLRCAWYFGSQGHQGLEDDRDHWEDIGPEGWRTA